MSKFFVGTENIYKDKNVIKITGEDVNHIRNVLRKITGDTLIVCDGMGWDYYSEITDINKNEVVLRYSEVGKCDTEPGVKYFLFQGIAKGERMDILIQKSVELGVHKIIPVECTRTVVKLNNDREREQKRAKWQKIASESAKQCDRGIIPEIHPPVDFENAVNMARDFRLNIIPYENERKVTLKDILSKNINTPEQVAVFIGPEGGFDDSEIKTALNNNITPVSLGSRILRTETAGPAVLSVLNYFYE